LVRAARILGTDVQAASRAVGRALSRPSTYPGAVKEALTLGAQVAMYPVGLLSEALDTETAPMVTDRFSRTYPLTYLDPEAAATPIILLHGYFHNRSAFLVMRRALRRYGFRTVTPFNYNALGHTVKELAGQVAAHVDEVLAKTGATRVHIVGHSLGGLVGRAYVQLEGGADKVHTCVTLGTPHGGTYAAWIGRGRAAREIRPGSALLTELERTARRGPVRFVSYYSNLDALVIPAAHAKLATPALRARNVLVKDHGHLSLLISGPLIRSIAATLADLEHPAARAEVLPIRPAARRRVAPRKRAGATEGA
jgi:triacylglycerol lipase